MPNLIIFGDSNSGAIYNGIVQLQSSGAFPLPGGWAVVNYSVGAQKAGLPSPATPEHGKANVLDKITNTLVVSGDVCFVCYGSAEALDVGLVAFPSQGTGDPNYTADTAGQCLLEIRDAIEAVGATCILVRPCGIWIQDEYEDPDTEGMVHVISDVPRLVALYFSGHPEQISYWQRQNREVNWLGDAIHVSQFAQRQIAIRIRHWMRKNVEGWS